MTSKEKILAKIKQNQPQPIDYPDIPDFEIGVTDLWTAFEVALNNIGGSLRRFPSRQALDAAVEETLQTSIGRSYLNNEESASLNEEPEVTFIRGEIAVAENAAVFVNGDQLPQRAIPYLGYRLIMVVSGDRICYNLHQAYAEIPVKTLGFGVFIAGPSATADIAQVLVRGAHGPTKTEVWVFDSVEE